jgi:hypothetical protein
MDIEKNIESDNVKYFSNYVHISFDVQIEKIQNCMSIFLFFQIWHLTTRSV